ncbi:MAG: EAL domain-containing protein [Pseudomonadota bacterium]
MATVQETGQSAGGAAEAVSRARADVAAGFEATIEAARGLRRALSPLLAAANAEGDESAAEQASLLKEARQRISAVTQTGDSVDQRLDHVEQGLARAGDHEPMVRAGIGAILDGQLLALSETLTDETDRLTEALRQIAEGAPALAAEVGLEGETADITAALDLLQCTAVDALRAAAVDLTAIAPAVAAQLAETDDQEASPPSAEAFAWLDSLYTMDSERRVQAEVLERLARLPSAEPEVDESMAAEAPKRAGQAAAAQIGKDLWERVLAQFPLAETPTGFGLGLLLTLAAGVAIAVSVPAAPAAALALLALWCQGGGMILFRRAARRLAAKLQVFERMALRDPLTDLLNRRALTDWLAAALAPGRDGAPGPATALHIDLDHFKAVNDTLGHEAGDHVLVVASDRMREALAAHTQGGEVCRIGGDEFAIVLSGAETEAAEAVAAAVVESLRQPIDWQGKTCRIGASIGIAQGGGTTGVTAPERLLTDADLATYTAKAEGRGRYAFFDTALREEMEREARLVEALDDALSASRLEIWFQPVVTLDASAVVAAEALLRWRDPELGEVPPEQIMGVAERHGLLERLHRETIDLTLDAMVAWRDEGIDLPLITLNFSPLQMRFPDLVAQLATALEERGLPATSLGIEVAEAALGGRGGDLARRSCAEAADRGMAVIVDRFGRDDCALATVGAMRGRLAKIDRALVAQLGQDAEGATLLRGLVALAGSLSLPVIATGVETRDQLEQLGAVGCDGLQGFAVARPMGAGSFATWLSFTQTAPLPSAAPGQPARQNPGPEAGSAAAQIADPARSAGAR